MGNDLHVHVAEHIVAGAGKSERPIELPDPHEYISQVNLHIGKLLALVAQIPGTMPWDVVTPELFSTRVASLNEEGKLGALWLDLTNQALAYTALAAWKARSIIQSVVRSINASELIGPAVLSRSLLELATSTIVHVRETIGLFEAIGASPIPIACSDQELGRIEEALQKAIWSSRIGTSKISEKMPLWPQSPYPEGTVEASNILSSFQKVAKEAPDGGATAFRVYEWLCDLVHPATQGLRVFWDSFVEITPGHRRFTLKDSGASDQTFVQALVLWATGYSAVALHNTLERLGRSITGVHERLPSVYGLARTHQFRT